MAPGEPAVTSLAGAKGPRGGNAPSSPWLGGSGGDGLLPSAGLRVSQCWGTWQTREWGTQGSGVPRGPGCEELGKSEGRVWGISGTRWEGQAATWSMAPGGQGQAEAGCGGLPRGAVCFTVPRPQGPAGLTRPSVGTTQVPRLSPTPQCGAGRPGAEAGAEAGAGPGSLWLSGLCVEAASQWRSLRPWPSS